MLDPQQNDIRQKLDLSGFWQFKLDPDQIGEEQDWFNCLEQPRQIAVPGSWNEQFQDTRDYLDHAWYLRRFHVPSGWQGQDVWVRIGSANYYAKVWVNGQLVGEHEGGHLPFDLNVTDQVKWDDANTIAIQVEAQLRPDRVPPGNLGGGGMAGFMSGYPNTAFDFFPYAGLHRPVVLYALPPVRIHDVTVATSISDNTGVVDITVVRSDSGNGVGRVRLQGENANIDEPLVFKNGLAKVAIQVSNAQLWSPDEPYLYQVDVLLSEGARISDRYTLEIGIRTISVHGDKLLLNGKPIQLKGFGKHEDFPIHGRGLNMPLIVKDAALFKWMGANSYRTSHYPYSEEAMTIADREGFLIVDEIPAVGLLFEDGKENIQARLKLCKQQLQELVSRDKNHPSVIMWSVANEPMPASMIQRFTGRGGEADDSRGTAFFTELYDLVHALDPTRPATSAAVMGCPVEWMALSDVVFVNRYWGWYTQSGQPAEGEKVLAQELDALHEQLGKPIVISEFGADTIAGMHSDPPEMWTEEYQVDFLRRYLNVAAARPFVVGLHVWNFADFKTGQGTRRAGGMNYKGVFTRDRRPKMAAHFLRERWLKPVAAPVAAPSQAETPADKGNPDLDALLQSVAARLSATKPENDTTIKLELGDAIVRLVVQNGTCRIENGDGQAAAAITATQADIIKMFTGQLQPMVAVMTGKIKVSGDMKALMMLQNLR